MSSPSDSWNCVHASSNAALGSACGEEQPWQSALSYMLARQLGMALSQPRRHVQCAASCLSLQGAPAGRRPRQRLSLEAAAQQRRGHVQRERVPPWGLLRGRQAPAPWQQLWPQTPPAGQCQVGALEPQLVRSCPLLGQIQGQARPFAWGLDRRGLWNLACRGAVAQAAPGRLGLQMVGAGEPKKSQGRQNGSLQRQELGQLVQPTLSAQAAGVSWQSAKL